MQTKLTLEEFKKLTPEERLRYSYTRTPDQPEPAPHKKAPASRGNSFLELVIGVPLGLSIICLACAFLAVVFNGLTAEPIAFNKGTMDLIQMAVFTLLITGPLAWKFRNHID